MKHIVYETKNKVNGKIYVGAHKCEFIDDGYLGSGVGIKNAIMKYGRDSFERKILRFCDTEDEMYETEASIVDEEFVRRSDTYNQCLGGKLGGTQGWAGVNNLPYEMRFSESHRRKISESCSGDLNGFFGKTHNDEQRAKWPSERSGTRLGEDNTFYGRTHTEETKRKIAVNGWQGAEGQERRANISAARRKGEKWDRIDEIREIWKSEGMPGYSALGRRLSKMGFPGGSYETMVKVCKGGG